jgi:hypothetical protein
MNYKYLKMTSYSVVAPIIIARFQGNTNLFYQAWSPRRYGPIYQYDIIIEGEDNQHPMMNIEYIDFLHQICDQLNLDNSREDDENDLLLGRRFLDMSTDYHSTTPLDERGDECYVVVIRGSVIFSPVFFLREDVELYLAFLENEFVTLRPHFQILTIPHASI